MDRSIWNAVGLLLVILLIVVIVLLATGDISLGD